MEGQCGITKATGIMFQLSGPEMENARGPSVFVRDAGTTRLQMVEMEILIQQLQYAIHA